MKKFIKVDGNIGYLKMMTRKNGYYGVANGPWGWWRGLDATSPYRAKIGGEGLEKEWVNGARQRRPGEKEEEDRIAAAEIEEFLLENNREPPEKEKEAETEKKEKKKKKKEKQEEKEKEKKKNGERQREERERKEEKDLVRAIPGTGVSLIKNNIYGHFNYISEPNP